MTNHPLPVNRPAPRKNFLHLTRNAQHTKQRHRLPHGLPNQSPSPLQQAQNRPPFRWRQMLQRHSQA